MVEKSVAIIPLADTAISQVMNHKPISCAKYEGSPTRTHLMRSNPKCLRQYPTKNVVNPVQQRIAVRKQTLANNWAVPQP